MAYMLLTGATGLLGGYLLRDALRLELPVAVIVRRSTVHSATRRIDAVLAPFERERAFPRPVVLEGDLSKPNLGLSDHDRQWLRDHCGSVLHSAASISFYREEKSGEPYRTNVEGTRRLLDLCREFAIGEFHHVSTAYVCGRRSGRIMESDLDVGQEHGNDYELSKIAAEKMVHAAGLRQTPTIYRPSIIVGDSETGHTTTFHGYYTPIQVAWWLAKAGVLTSGVDDWFLAQLGLSGQERKNIVPVDWVSRAILHLVGRPEAHGRTYHLTCDNPPTATELALAIGDVLKPRLSRVGFQPASEQNSSNELGDLMEANDFRKHMDVYRAYFRDHPEFDNTNLRQFAPDLPCPKVDREMLARTGAYALEANFGWPRVQPPAAPIDVESLLWRAGDMSPLVVTGNQDTFCTLEITGVGGGAWALPFNTGGLTSPARPGRAECPSATIRMRSDTLAALVSESLSLDDALVDGRVLIAAPSSSMEAAVDLARAIISARTRKSEVSEQASPMNGHSLTPPAIRVRANLGETTK